MDSWKSVFILFLTRRDWYQPDTKNLKVEDACRLLVRGVNQGFGLSYGFQNKAPLFLAV